MFLRCNQVDMGIGEHQRKVRTILFFSVFRPWKRKIVWKPLVTGPETVPEEPSRWRHVHNFASGKTTCCDFARKRGRWSELWKTPQYGSGMDSSEIVRHCRNTLLSVSLNDSRKARGTDSAIIPCRYGYGSHAQTLCILFHQGNWWCQGWDKRSMNVDMVLTLTALFYSKL